MIVFLHQHITRPTRYRNGAVPSILDLVVTNEEGMIRGMEYLPGLSSSDHLVLRFTVVCYTAPNSSQLDCKYALRNADFDGLRREADKLDWDSIQDLDFQQAYSFLEGCIASLIDQHIPKVKVRKTRNLYMNSDALRLRKRKRMLWATYIQSGSAEDYSNFTICRNRLRKLTRKLRKDLEARITYQLKMNPKLFWRYANTRLKTKTGIDVLLDADGEERSAPEDKADILSRYFSSVFAVEDTTSQQPPEAHFPPAEKLTNVTITAGEVKNKLLNLNIAGAPGPDGLHPRVLRELADQIAVPLSQVFMKCLAASDIPKEWRHAVIVPIHKKGPKNLARNYRPISLTSAICKVMEAVMKDKIMTHLECNDLLSPHQHGFRSGRSCTTQLLEALDLWTQAIEGGQSMDVIYLDFSKAFDSVPHGRLLSKVKAFGIEGQVLRWVEAFLTGRTQQVVVEGTRSSCSAVTSGVPQGSVLGPLLFLLYINDMPDGLHSSIKLFADDSKVFGPAQSAQARECLQHDLHELGHWSKQWQLPFNLEKCKALHLGSNNPCASYVLLGQTLTPTEQENDLGIVVDGALNFHAQTAAAVAKANKLLGIVRKSFVNLSKDSLPILFKSLILPHLDYANCIWGPMSKGDQRLVEKVQRRATKLVPDLQFKPYSQRLEELGLPSLTYRRLRGDMITIYQILNGSLHVHPGLLQLSTCSRTRGHHLKLQKPRARTRSRRNYLSVRAVNSWNSLPSHVISAPSINAFKSRLDSHWRSIQFVSVFDD